MWYTSPEFWSAVGAVIVAVTGLIKSTHAKTRADDAHALALGHALDKASHPLAPPRPVTRARAARPSSPAGPSSG